MAEGRTTSASAPPRGPVAELWRKIGDPLLPATIYAAARLHLLRPTLERPATLEEVGTAAGVDSRMLRRTMELLEGEGLVERTDPAGYRATPLGRLLEDPAVNAQLRYWFEIHVPYVLRLDLTVRDGRASFDRVLGQGLYRFLDQAPEFSDLLRAELGLGSEDAARILQANFDFSPIRTVVDIGGSTGALLAELLPRWPQLRAVLFDSRRAVDAALSELSRAGVEERCRRVAGDFFHDRIPAADVGILSWILCEWPDEAAVTLLRNCRRPMGERGRLLILEPLIWGEPPSRRLRELDLLIGATVGGHLRTADEFGALLARAGFRLEKATRTRAYMDVVEAVPEEGTASEVPSSR